MSCLCHYRVCLLVPVVAQWSVILCGLCHHDRVCLLLFSHPDLTFVVDWALGTYLFAVVCGILDSCCVSCLCHCRVCLLVVVTQWTVMLCVMFVSAHNVEAAIVDNVYQISDKMVRFSLHMQLV